MIIQGQELMISPSGALVTTGGARAIVNVEIKGVDFVYYPPSAPELSRYLKTHLTPGWQGALDQVFRLDSAMKRRNWGGMPCPRRVYGAAEIEMSPTHFGGHHFRHMPTGRGDLIFYWGVMSGVIVRFGANGQAACTIGGSEHAKHYGPFLDAPTQLLDCLEFHATQEALKRVSL